jgi:hypothetical protein
MQGDLPNGPAAGVFLHQNSMREGWTVRFLNFFLGLLKADQSVRGPR